MNKFSLNQQSSSFGSLVVISGILACQSLPIEPNKVYPNTIFENDIYSLDSSSSTFSEYSHFSQQPFAFEPINEIFEKTVGDFYSTLLANQEPLGEEFEKVLFDNLWELYED